MKKITIAEYLKDIDTEELIEMISDTKSWYHIHLRIMLSCVEDLNDSMFGSGLDTTKSYITNELTYFINDDEYSLSDLEHALNFFLDDVPDWIQDELAMDIESVNVSLRAAIEEDDRRQGFDI